MGLTIDKETKRETRPFKPGDRVRHVADKSGTVGTVLTSEALKGSMKGSCLVHVPGETGAIVQERWTATKMRHVDKNALPRLEVGDRVRTGEGREGTIVGFEGNDEQGYDNTMPLVDFGEAGGEPEALDLTRFTEIIYGPTSKPTVPRRSPFEVGDHVRTKDGHEGQVIGLQSGNPNWPIVDFGDGPTVMGAPSLDPNPRVEAPVPTATLNELRDVLDQFGAKAVDAAQRLSALGAILDQLKPGYEDQPALSAAVVEQARAIASSMGEAQAMLDRTLAGLDAEPPA